MSTRAFLYKWTHIPTQKWYVGSRTAKGCHPDDGYICSSRIVKPLVTENQTEWARTILAIGPPEYISELENRYLTLVDAKNDCMSFNLHNGNLRSVPGDKNPMKNPIVAEINHARTRGSNHWTQNLGDREHPQKGQERLSIRGNKHPNKRPEVAAKIRAALIGRKHPYQEGDNNPMRDPNVVAKLSGKNHWTKNEKNNKLCEYCGVTISKSNYTRWHGQNCKLKDRICRDHLI